MTTPTDARGGTIRTFDGPLASGGARHVELVFRKVRERTSELALQLAIEHIRPERVHVIDSIAPFSRAVARMLELPHARDPSDPTSHVVHVDADCLILEDMRPFLDANPAPYVDCYVHDRFRGRVHCGVHITRADVLQEMARIQVPEGDLAYVLRPESRLRNYALTRLGLEKRLKTFHILHDHFQDHVDIFAKYALRELRSRTEAQRARLTIAMDRWGDTPDLAIARRAIEHARVHVPETASVSAIEAYVEALAETARREIGALGIAPQPPLERDEIDRALANEPALRRREPPAKVFGIGLGRTGARSLNAALHVLGIDTVHFPLDDASLDAIEQDDARFPLLEHFDGITGVTTVPFVERLADAYPDARFVLTTREETSWLRSLEAREREADAHGQASPRRACDVAGALQARIYGTSRFDPSRLRATRDAHLARVTALFRGREERLLQLDPCAGEGFERLAPFLGLPLPGVRFPHKGRSKDEPLANLEIDD